MNKITIIIGQAGTSDYITPIKYAPRIGLKIKQLNWYVMTGSDMVNSIGLSKYPIKKGKVK